MYRNTFHTQSCMSLSVKVSLKACSCFSRSDCNGVGGVTGLRPNGAPPAGLVDCLHLAAKRPQDVHELTPELHTHKGVQDGIEAAVEVTYGGGDYPGFL